MDRQNLWNSVDNYKRKIFIKNELKKTVLRSIIVNKNTTYTRRYLSRYYMSNLPKFATRTVSNTRCVYSGRSWGVSQSTLMSRFINRNKVYNSEIPGCSRASW